MIDPAASARRERISYSTVVSGSTVPSIDIRLAVDSRTTRVIGFTDTSSHGPPGRRRRAVFLSQAGLAKSSLQTCFPYVVNVWLRRTDVSARCFSQVGY